MIKQKIIVIVGPTTSGKSDLAIKLAKKINGEIVSADSRQVYRGMDIGTGKVKKDKYKGRLCTTKTPFVSNDIRHYLIDVINPKRQFTANDFKKLGERVLSDIARRTKVPIIVGGTGFYIDVLLGRVNLAEVPPNKKFRKRFNKLSAEHLFKMLRKLDPKQAKNIDRYNKRRLVRALEILNSNKKSIKPEESPYHDGSTETMLSNYKILWLGLNPGKEKLAKQIKKRLDARLKQGMIKEVDNLHNPPTGEGISWKRLDDFGLEYRQIARYLRNQKLNSKNQKNKSKIKNFKESEYYEKLLREIIKYSKRQMTWFKRNKEIDWMKDYKTAERLAQRFLC